MKITNISQGPRGVNTTSGAVLIEPGQEVDVELNAAEAKIAKATGWFDIEGKPKAEAKKAEGGSDDSGANGGLVAKHSGGGRYFVLDGGEKVSDVMTKDDAEAFNALSDEDKAAFVAKA